MNTQAETTQLMRLGVVLFFCIMERGQLSFCLFVISEKFSV
jgi:hypothetical protein